MMNNSLRGRPKSLGLKEIQTLLKRGFDALNAKNLDEAGACCKLILSSAPKTVQAHFLVGLISLENKQTGMAVHAFGSVTKLDPSYTAAWTQLASAYFKIGQPKSSEDAIERAIELGTKDPFVQDMIGSVLSRLGNQVGANYWYGQAVAGDPKSAGFKTNLGSSLIFLGETDEAEIVLDQSLKINPSSAHTHWLKSGLRRATNHKHLDELKVLMKKYHDQPDSLPFVSFAAGKEYEDLGEWEEAFQCFAGGGAAKRQVVSYDESAEVEMFEAFRETFTPEWAAQEIVGDPSPGPIFILGQPRTGTTLVERIVTSHSMVHSAGELQQFRLSIRRHIEGRGSGTWSAEEARASGLIDPTYIGEAYMRSTSEMTGGFPRFVDKMPVNFMFVPLILKALPNAKIIHLVRNPVDSCFSSFKQLFAQAYYHSYDLEEMARHHVRYVKLMAYWRELLPGRFLDVKYEDVVADLDPNARRLINHLELPWEDACLEFHTQDKAVMTASAVQVREKAHTRSVDRWRRYETELAPVLEILQSEGVEY